MLKHGILGLLNYGEMTGYEIKEVFARSLNFFWTAQTSQIYRELQVIERNQWAESTLIEQVGKPDKKVFSITKEGKEELLRWMAQGETGLAMRTPLLMKVFFLGERSVEENLLFFEGFRVAIAEYLERLQSVNENIDYFSAAVPDKQKIIYWEMTLDFGKRSLQMHLDWVDDCIARLSALPKDKNIVKNESFVNIQP